MRKLLIVLVMTAFALSLMAAPALAIGPNLITNGDFEAGNTGFSSDYTYVPLPGYIMNPAEYNVVTNPKSVHSAFASYGDHTTGLGKMMVVNASLNPSDRVWWQTVSVIPNADYNFSAWVSTCYPRAPARLEFSINSSSIGTITAPTTAGPPWQEFTKTDWNSGSSTSATIQIVDLTAMYSGDDFALDDISLEIQRIHVQIDIKPCSFPNSINPNERGAIPVAILGCDYLNVYNINVTSLTLQGLTVKMVGKASKCLAHYEDVNFDGHTDLVVQFQDSDGWVAPGNGTATLTGELNDGTPIVGSDSINIVPPQ